MAGNELAAAYLARIQAHGTKVAELVAQPPNSKMLNAVYKDRYLSRPLFLTAAERELLAADVENLRSALVSLPDRLFGGNLAEFLRAVGLAEVQIAAIERSRAADVTHFARADLYTDPTGFKVMEFNMGSTLGGVDSAELNRAMLHHHGLADFVEENGLTFVDTQAEQMHTLFSDTGIRREDRPFIVLCDWPTSYKDLQSYLEAAVDVWKRDFDIDGAACHLGQLEARDGGIYLGDQKVDIVYRLFMLEDLLESPEAPAVFEPVLAAAERGEVKIFTPLDAEAFGSKGALAMLSDEANRHAFSAEELASLDRILPWTRILRDAPATLENGERVDLLAYAIENQHELALKPTMLHGGGGVVLGWDENVSAAEWEKQLRQSLGGDFTLQRRIRPTSELALDAEGEVVPWTVVWGIFSVANGFGGVYARAVPAEEQAAHIINLGSGAYVGCAFHQV